MYRRLPPARKSAEADADCAVNLWVKI